MEITLEVVTLALAFTSLAVTVAGFFASLWFFREGVDLQNRASTALGRIEEKTALIQQQFGGAFDRTLNAVLEQLPAAGTLAEQTTGSSGAGGNEVAAEAFRYYSLRGLSFSDVSAGWAKTLFGLARSYGFNLLEGGGLPGYLYVGSFPVLPQREVIARAVLLYRALDRAWQAVKETREGGVEVLNSIYESLRVELIVSDDVAGDAVIEAVENLELDMEARPPLKVITASEIADLIDAELESIGV